MTYIRCKGHNFPDAAKLYTQAIELDPTDKTYWCNRAIARMKLEEYGYALNDASMPKIAYF